jgi:hypothetical protein
VLKRSTVLTRWAALNPRVLAGQGPIVDQAAESREEGVEADLEFVVAADPREDVGVPHEERGGGRVARSVQPLPVLALARVGGVKTKVELHRPVTT